MHRNGNEREFSLMKRTLHLNFLKHLTSLVNLENTKLLFYLRLNKKKKMNN